MKLLLIALALVLLVVPSYAQDFDKGMAAYKQGDFVAALGELRPLAEAGNTIAQSLLGLMYLNGQGVPQDFERAAKWLEEAARKEDDAASWILGSSCAFGHDRLVSRTEQGIVVSERRRGATDPTAQEVISIEDLFMEVAQIPACEFLAEEGDASGAVQLSAIYQHGIGAPQDQIKSLFWFDIGLHMASWYDRTQLGWVEQRNELASTMTADQIAKAQRMASEWLNAHPQ